jgi:hypothetical protein
MRKAMADKKCPYCGLWSTGSAILCDCGYNFEKGRLERSNDSADRARRIIPFSLVSLFLSIVGILTAPLAFSEPPVVYMGMTIGTDLHLPLAFISFVLSPLSTLFSLITGVIALTRREAWWPIALIGISLAIVPLYYIGAFMWRSLVQ